MSIKCLRLTLGAAALALATSALASSSSKVQFRFEAFPSSIALGSTRTLTTCFLNEGNAATLLASDALVVEVPVGALDADLLADTTSLSCTDPTAGWTCALDTSDPAVAVFTFHPSIPTLVSPGQTLCFDMTDASINGEQGISLVELTQNIPSNRANPPSNRLAFVFKGQPDNLFGPAGGELTGFYPDPEIADNVIDLANLTFDPATQVELNAEAATRAANDTTETNARIAADNAEVAARTAADTTLQNNINAEAATRAANDTTETNARIAADNAEAAARTTADTTLQNNINAEAATRAANDTTETNARTVADTTLQNNINAEASTRAANDNHSGDVSGAYNNLQIGGGVVGAFEIADGSVTGAEISDSSVTGADIQNGTIGSADVNVAQVQLRVTGACPGGYSIRAIFSDGSVTCEYDDDTGISRNTPLYRATVDYCSHEGGITVYGGCDYTHCCGFICLDTCTDHYDYTFVGWSVD